MAVMMQGIYYLFAYTITGGTQGIQFIGMQQRESAALGYLYHGGIALLQISGSDTAHQGIMYRYCHALTLPRLGKSFYPPFATITGSDLHNIGFRTLLMQTISCYPVCIGR